jgi:S-adenosylmethionine:tRNA ribosyltransferase-isomerase
MLVLEASGIEDSWVRRWPELVPEGALVVLNDTRVRHARLFGQRRPGGGQVEFLLLRPITESTRAEVEFEALGRANKPLRAGTRVDAPPFEVEVLDKREDGSCHVVVRGGSNVELELERHGHVPIPPYVDRADDEQDAERYQTVYARALGSVAAPTAGLHLTPEMLETLRVRGVAIERVTLHIGVGTFRPVSTDTLEEHPMHSEWYEVEPALCDAIEGARARKAPVVAVGTTVVRALESARDPERDGLIAPGARDTRLLISPGYRFSVVDGLLTNFHMPKSTLLALVAAFAGLDRTLAAYRHAVAAEYRFLSYGDAMWIPARVRA